MTQSYNSQEVRCHGGCHVYLTGQPRCQCGQAANGYPPVTAMMYFPGYNPYGYRQPKPDSVPETSLSQLRAALRAGASWLSADGQRAYRDDRGNAEIAHWDGATGMYGSWWAAEAVPAEAVKL